MKELNENRIRVSWRACYLAGLDATQVRAADSPSLAPNDVVWTALGQNENDSMPIGNGDPAANFWTEQYGPAGFTDRLTPDRCKAEVNPAPDCRVVSIPRLAACIIDTDKQFHLATTAARMR